MTEIATKQTPYYAETELAAIKSFDDALAMFNETERGEDFADYGSGFEVLETSSKSRLIGVPFIALDWFFRSGDNGDYVVAHIVTKAGEKLVLTDGSTGILKQLRRVTDARVMRGWSDVEARANLICRSGLTESAYQYADEKTGELRNATTYYIA